MGMDVFAEDGGRYNIRLSSEKGSGGLELTVFEGFAGSVQMHVTSLSVEAFLMFHSDTRRVFKDRVGVLFPIDTFGIITSWVRMNQELTR